MARQIIGVQHEPVYRNGRMIGYYTHEDWVERPDPTATHQMQPSPTPTLQGPPPSTPIVAQVPQQPRIVTLTTREFSRLCVEATMEGVPPLPQTLDGAVALQRARGQR